MSVAGTQGGEWLRQLEAGGTKPELSMMGAGGEHARSRPDGSGAWRGRAQGGQPHQAARVVRAQDSSQEPEWIISNQGKAQTSSGQRAHEA